MNTKSKIQKTIPLLGFACLFSLQVGCLSDIRPELLKNGNKNEASIQKARTLLQEMADAHGGWDKWQAQKNARMIFRDEWPGLLMRTMGMPWGKNSQKIQLDWLIGSDNSRLEFLEDPDKGEVWGIQNWATYTKQGTAIEFDQDDDIKFWLPTVQYFAEGPFRLQAGKVVYYGGERKIKNKTYDLVFISWKTDKPQDDIDQYVAWIHRGSKRLEYLQYTVRDMMPFMKSTMRYSDFKTVNGFLLAQRLTVIDTPDPDEKEFLHEFYVEEIKFDLELPKEHFVPNPKRKLYK